MKGQVLHTVWCNISGKTADWGNSKLITLGSEKGSPFHSFMHSFLPSTHPSIRKLAVLKHNSIRCQDFLYLPLFTTHSFLHSFRPPIRPSPTSSGRYWKRNSFRCQEFLCCLYYYPFIHAFLCVHSSVHSQLVQIVIENIHLGARCFKEFLSLFLSIYSYFFLAVISEARLPATSGKWARAPSPRSFGEERRPNPIERRKSSLWFSC